ncbi:MAG TPA: hypothetical protein VFD58_18550 [Blastocatellia bacterium]|nr:hypothetical protein [Blastocatellia bacterium]
MKNNNEPSPEIIREIAMVLLARMAERLMSDMSVMMGVSQVSAPQAELTICRIPVAFEYCARCNTDRFWKLVVDDIVCCEVCGAMHNLADITDPLD